MIRSILKKVMWIGRATVFMVGLTVVLSVMLGIATTAIAATGGNFLLGKSNSAGAVSKLAAKIAGPTLQLVNTSTNATATALSLNVAAGKPPMKVNSSTKVANLNSDKLDGKDSSQLVQGNGTTSRGQVALPPGTEATILTTSNPNVQLSYVCPGTLANDGQLKIKNTSAELVNFFVKEDRGPTFYAQLQPGGTADTGMVSSGDHATIQVQGTSLVTIEAFTAHRPSGIIFTSNDCHTQAQALVTR